ncbi:hypothetical protein BUE80_DR000909 [Diplocarpon rosae]|nr:hypothetical protein BUE80_DR000909 [Diplocarpon rosae]
MSTSPPESESEQTSLLQSRPSAKPAASLSEPHPITPNTGQDTEQDTDTEMETLSRKSQWIVLALASGGCAAFNGVFAKLTTTELTTTFSTWLADLFGLGNIEGGVEAVVRAIFFGLNLIFNGIMWTLFTKALARGTSTTQVSILNTSANFMITAVLGWLIFSESLPPLWFLGAALLVAGNVIIGRREEGEGKDAGDQRVRRDSGEEGAGLLGEELELDGEVGEEETRRNRSEEEEDVLQLDLEGSNAGRERLI